jgi:hypothetical protein
MIGIYPIGAVGATSEVTSPTNASCYSVAHCVIMAAILRTIATTLIPTVVPMSLVSSISATHSFAAMLIGAVPWSLCSGLPLRRCR